MSMTIMYLVSGSSPDTLILMTGNILLQQKNYRLHTDKIIWKEYKDMLFVQQHYICSYTIVYPKLSMRYNKLQ